MNSKSEYLKKGRIADVLALMQVLALDKDAHRSLSGINQGLQGTPRSAASWEALAKTHPEFFRVNPDAQHGISLVARHVTPKDDAGQRPLPAEYTSSLLMLAVELHDREVNRSKWWHVWLSFAGAVIGGVVAAAIR